MKTSNIVAALEHALFVFIIAATLGALIMILLGLESALAEKKALKLRRLKLEEARRRTRECPVRRD